MDKKKRETIKMVLAGLFFIFGIFSIIFAVLVIGSDKGIMESKMKVHVIYNNIGGLIEGAPVRLSGVVVGNVQNIDFASKRVNGKKVLVTLEIFDKFKKQLNNSAVFKIKTEGVLGEKLVEISVPYEDKNFQVKKVFIGQDPIDAQDMAEVFKSAALSLTKTAENLGSIDVKGLSDSMGDTSKALLITSANINDLFREMQQISFKMKRLLDRIEQRVIDGTLFKVF